MTIVFGIEADQKKVQHKFEFAFNLKKPQAPRHTRGPQARGHGGMTEVFFSNWRRIQIYVELFFGRIQFKDNCHIKLKVIF